MDFSGDNTFFDETFGLGESSSEMPISLKRKESWEVVRDMVPAAKRAAIDPLILGRAVDDAESFAHTVPEPFAPFTMTSTDEDVILSDAEIEAALSEVSSTLSGDDGDDDTFSSDDNDSLYDFDDEEPTTKETTTKSGRVVMSKIVASKAKASKSKAGSSKSLKGKSNSKKRGNYLCSKCGLPKKGHVCQSRSRRRGGAGPGPRLTQRQLQAARLARSGKTLTVPATAGVKVPAAPVPAKMVSTGTQCEIGDSILRTLHVDSQGFPESYTNGIFADPTFCVESAPKVVVSGPPPKELRAPQGKKN